jgi:hypothetical protein
MWVSSCEVNRAALPVRPMLAWRGAMRLPDRQRHHLR